jgi:hypothetical protein
MREFACNSTTQGVRHMGESNMKSVIAFWAFVVFLCAIGYGYLAYDTMTKYLSYPVNVQVSVSAPLGRFIELILFFIYQKK